MFRPVYILQAACFSLFLLSGCSTGQAGPQGGQSTPTIQNPASEPGHETPPARPVEPGSFLDAKGYLLPEFQAFAIETSENLNIPLNQVQALLSAARLNTTALRLMTPSTKHGRRSWIAYRTRHVDPIRIRAGVAFWNEHRDALTRASQTYGVPPSIIVAIIGIETVYGRYTGNFRVLDTLATLGFRYPDPDRPERQKMFREQLADLIDLDHEGRLDAYSVEGSFAGAIGLPQFMPGSLAKYSADGDADGRIDVATSIPDALASVARFLRMHGWTPGLPVFAPVRLPPDPSDLVHGGLTPDLSWQTLQAAGARLIPNAHSGDAWQHHPLGVIDLPDEPRKQTEYRTATPNFFAITHYNRSYFYATSVTDLAHELADRVGYGDPNRIVD
ncbi:MAG: lytic murein transglycosylase B [Alcaligenaceae bacterium]|nr:lytic murein transglycosylase B [Alcaligenaceae bacterium]